MIEAVLLGAGAAAGYGLADFLSGLWSRRVGIVVVLVGGQLAGLLVLAVAGPLISPGTFYIEDVVWGVLAGVAAAAGIVLLLRGFQLGRLSVVSPASSLAAAGTPLLVDVAAGVEVSTLSMAGMAGGLLAIWLVCSGEPRRRESTEDPYAGLLYGLLSGIGFGGTFLALGESSPDSGAWPVVWAQVALAIGAVLLLMTRRPLPPVTLGAIPSVATIGVAGALATLSFLLAARAGIVSVAAVIASLSPAVTVMLAWIFIREPLGTRRVSGLVIAVVALVSIGGG